MGTTEAPQLDTGTGVLSPDALPAADVVPWLAAEPVPRGSIILHIGPPKTGTTAIQAAFFAAREAARDQGVHYAGSSRHSATAVEAAIGLRVLHERQAPPRWRWTGLLHEIRASKAPRVVLSSEFLAHAGPAAATRVVGELGPQRVHVVVTLRPIATILPSHWQQAVGRGTRRAFEPWLKATLPKRDQPVEGTFWWWHRHDLLIERWAAIVGPDRLHVVIADPRDRTALPSAFEGLAGLRAGTLALVEDVQNRSLTRDEAELVRLFNGLYQAQGLDMSAYDRLVPLGAVRLLKRRRVDPNEPRIVLPAWAADEVNDLQVSMVDRVRAMGVDVRGDLDLLLAGSPAGRLGPTAGVAGPSSASPEAGAPLELGAAFAVALAEASGVSTVPGVGAGDLVARKVRVPGDIAAQPASVLAAALAMRLVRTVSSRLRRLRRSV